MASSKNIQTLTTTTLARLSAFVSNHFDSIAHSRFRTLYQLQCQSIEETKVQSSKQSSPSIFLQARRLLTKELSTLEHLKSGCKSPSYFTRSCLHDSSSIVGNLIMCAHFKSFSPPSSLEVVSVLMTNKLTIEEKIVEMEQKIVLFHKNA